MKHTEVVTKIMELSSDGSLDFANKVDQLCVALATCSLNDVLSHLEYVGVIPECFEHDSTEEKLYAKYCDALLARGLAELGLDAEMIRERSGAADVVARWTEYEIVGDAKAFRLSRSAKNQKDFKVEALNQWRGDADFACLVAPIYQYPNTSSQIYEQAIRYNVTLMSYTHLGFMIHSQAVDLRNMVQLWQVGETLQKSTGISQSASDYWSAILYIVLGITGKSQAEWDQAVQVTRRLLREQAKDQVQYWEEQKTRIKALDRPTAVKELIKALKIDAKIAVVRRTSGL